MDPSGRRCTVVSLVSGVGHAPAGNVWIWTPPWFSAWCSADSAAETPPPPASPSAPEETRPSQTRSEKTWRWETRKKPNDQTQKFTSLSRWFHLSLWLCCLQKISASISSLDVYSNQKWPNNTLGHFQKYYIHPFTHSPDKTSVHTVSISLPEVWKTCHVGYLYIIGSKRPTLERKSNFFKQNCSFGKHYKRKLCMWQSFWIIWTFFMYLFYLRQMWEKANQKRANI